MSIESEHSSPPGFDTFSGVVRPTLLTTLGALLFLREGWLVGNSGLVGALVVILAAYVITGTTALSVSSLATNVRVNAGGAFAMIAQALGLEAGGAIGIPLYMAQCASAALYLFAFGEAWLRLYPAHPIGWVVFAALLVVGSITMASARFAFKAQGPLFIIVGLAILCAWAGVWNANPTIVDPSTVPSRVSLPEAFAIFFPAATGLMVGVGMSGSLKNPRESIPKGILSAWWMSLSVYLVTAFWCASVAGPDELLTDKTVMISKAAFQPIVHVGLLCTTLMASASCLVAGPRLLQAMARQRVVPFGDRFDQMDEKGEPRHALWISLFLTGACLLSGSLDGIAQIVTVFFILTYTAINLVVMLEQRLGMVSFRPTMSVPRWIPPVGATACAVGLFVSSPAMGLLGSAFVVLIYIWLQQRKLQTPWETVRSGIHVRVAAWAAQRAGMGDRPERAWTPELLMPVETPNQSNVVLQLGRRIIAGVGSIRLVGMSSDSGIAMTLEDRAGILCQEGIPTTTTTVDAPSFTQGACMVIDSMRGLFMGPNLVMLDVDHRTEKELQIVVDHCHRRKVGIGLVLAHPDGAVGRASQVTVWLSERSPEWTLEMHNANLDLPALVGYLLTKFPGNRLRVATVVRTIEHRAEAYVFLQRLIDMGRLPKHTEAHVGQGEFLPAVQASPYADIHVFGLSTTVDRERLIDIRDAGGGACVFLLDSGQESILA
jgi:amino acid permease